jgi:hypothetical protein
LAERHPYAPGPGGITAAITQLRKSFPSTVNAETLKSLGIAPKNESYVINILRFIGAIDKDGKQTEKALHVFSQHDETDFQQAFEGMVEEAYSELFTLHKADTWQLPSSKLIAFFRSRDKTTDLVGQKQAMTFQLLAGLAGRGASPAPATSKPSVKTKGEKSKPEKSRSEKLTPSNTQSLNRNGESRDFGLTVRIEVNLPPAGDQETYDRIFRSIRENLLNAK